MKTAQIRSVFAIPGTLTVKGREFVIMPPSSSDVARVHDKMRELATRQCVNPLLAVNAVAGELAPGVLAESLRAAVAIGSGGGIEPTRESIARQYDTLDGIRWRVWFHARKALPALTHSEVESLIGEDDRYDVADALAEALGLNGVDPKSEAPASGAN